ncbi:nucleoside diphosphate kinase regulator [Vibrio parahaemolyticus]|nr:hypothetical protein [Vibrio parahaemolyticus]MCZ6288327.1 nucleoside diphosphate kinase regulator [Vibrio parahaemolyticus]MDF4422494.1 nucleoside diphosphate kinase regulator [Vibrio parahaemolyticus]MDF4773158.1 nucleoside diphosphate kinase regulator [Vibrio parahaemolyticus]MDF5186200.1 nucleoside diphosphate kinase regulator [Vibrio parahaemolyticus]MDF5201017.1 nucleoside diphosphate kinase regulator [Vibrio parahaemolyticus]
MIELGDISIEYAVNNKESVMLLKSSKVNAWKKEGNRGEAKGSPGAKS